MASESRTGTAMVFPGMGPSRFADVGKFMVINPNARRLVSIADDVLGYSLVDRLRESEEDYSEAAQVAFLVNCLALAEWAEETMGVEPDVCVGPSFGEKAAAAYSGALSVAETIRMTAELARCMADYFDREFRDVVTHSFVRTPEERLREVLAELDERGEWYDISCYIDHDFYMVSLRDRNLDWLQQRIRAAGGLSLYTMRPPMHSAAFGELRRRAEHEVFATVEFTDPGLPVIADQDGTLIETAEGVRTMLLDSFVRPLRWPEVVATMRRLGIGTAVVSGQDSLFGRVACTTRNFEVVPVNPRLALRPRRAVAV